MDWRTYGTNEFALHVPAQWPLKAVFSFIGPEVNRIPQSIVITQDTLSDPCTLESYAQDQVKQLKDQLRKFKLREESALTIRDQPTPMLAFTWKPQTSGAVAQFQVFFLRFPVVWTITGTTADGEQESLRPLFEHVATSFVNQLPGDQQA
jgi:hypothetical protein